ncbi:MAG: LPS export ABC transporter permease LptF [Candidatus Abyssubacteria bacterium]
MSILTRYITRRLVFYHIAIMMAMLIFFVFVDLMEHIDIVAQYRAPFRLVAFYYMCYLPRIFIEMSWFGFLASMLFVLGGLARNNEYTAMLAAGISIYRVGRPALVIGVILSLLVFCVQEFIVPQSMLAVQEIRESDFSDSPQGRRLFDIAGVGKRKRFYFFDVLDVDHGILKGVHIHTMGDGSTIVERIDAEEAVWDKRAEKWRLRNGTIKRFDANEVVTEDVSFESMDAPFRDSPRTLEISASGTGQFRFRQLRRQIKNLERSGYSAQRLKVNYHKKFALPAANIIVVLLALPFALERRRGGLMVGFALSLMAALLYYGAFQMGLALGKGDYLPAVVSAWLANFIFLGVGIALTMRART